MKPIKEIVIAERDDCLFFRVDSEGEHAKIVEINVGDGCYAVMYFNGRKYRAFPTGLYNFEWRMYERNSGKITLAAVNVNGTVKLPFGAGRIVYAFSDGASEIGINGSCVFKPIYYKSVPEDKRYSTCDKLQAAYSGKDKIGVDEIVSKWKSRMSNAVKSALASAVAARSGMSRVELSAAFDSEIKPHLIDAIYEFSEELTDEGLEIEDIVIDRLFIAESSAPVVNEVVEERNESESDEQSESADEQPVDDAEDEESEADETEETHIERSDDDGNDPADEHTDADRVDEATSGSGAATEEKVDCAKCGCANPAVAKFCKNCGAALHAEKRDEKTVECPTCKKRFERGTKFCKFCGTKLESDGANVCPTCKKPAQSGAAFCKFCGTKLI